MLQVAKSSPLSVACVQIFYLMAEMRLEAVDLGENSKRCHRSSDATLWN